MSLTLKSTLCTLLNGLTGLNKKNLLKKVTCKRDEAHHWAEYGDLDTRKAILWWQTAVYSV